jgi:hypothetical protein
MQVHLPAEYKDYIPPRAIKELVIRMERITRTDSEGTREVLTAKEDVYFLFNNFIIPFTGKVILNRPHSDWWEYPCDVEDVNYNIEAELWFEEGSLIKEVMKNM